MKAKQAMQIPNQDLFKCFKDSRQLLLDHEIAWHIKMASGKCNLEAKIHCSHASDMFLAAHQHATVKTRSVGQTFFCKEPQWKVEPSLVYRSLPEKPRESCNNEWLESTRPPSSPPSAAQCGGIAVKSFCIFVTLFWLWALFCAAFPSIFFLPENEQKPTAINYSCQEKKQLNMQKRMATWRRRENLECLKKAFRYAPLLAPTSVE